MKKTLIILSVLFIALGVNAQSFPVQDLLLKGRILGFTTGDTIVAPHPDSANQWVYMNMANPVNPLDGVNLRTLQDSIGGASILGLNNTWTGTNLFSNTVTVGAGYDLTVNDTIYGGWLRASNNGTAPIPAFGWASNGMYLVGANSIGFSVDNVLSATIEADLDWIFAGGGTFADSLLVPIEAYSTAWQNAQRVVSADGLYDKFESLSDSTSADISAIEPNAPLYSFDGVNDFITLPRLGVLSEACDFSVIMKIKMDDVTTQQNIYGVYNGANDRFTVAVQSGTIRATVYDGTNYSVSETVSTDTVVVAFQYTASTNTLTGYLDGVLMTGSTKVTSLMAVATKRISTNGIDKFFDGAVSDVYDFNYVVPATNIISWSEKIAHNNFEIEQADRWTTDNPADSYESDFSVGVDGWTASGVVATGNNDGISDGTTSYDNVMKNYADATSSHQNLRSYAGMSIGLGITSRLDVIFYIPSANSNTDGIRFVGDGIDILSCKKIVDGTNYGTISTTYINSVTGFWCVAVIETTGDGTTNLSLRHASGGSDSFTGANSSSDDILYFSEINSTLLGSSLSLNPASGTDLVWYDNSTNESNGTVSGATLIRNRVNGFDEIVADTDISVIGTAPYFNLTNSTYGQDANIHTNNNSGSLVLGADINNEVASSEIMFNIDGTERGSINASGDIQADGIADFDGTGVNAFAGSINIASGKEYQINTASINTAGTLTNVAYENQANVFTLDQTFNGDILTNSDGSSDIGATGTRWNHIYGNTVHADLFTGSDFILGEVGSKITVNADSLLLTDIAYSSAWQNSDMAVSANSIYDKIETLTSFSSGDAHAWTAAQTYNDNIKLQFGTSGAESEIYSDGSQTFVKVINGDVFFRDESDNGLFTVNDDYNSTQVVKFYAGGTVEAYVGTSGLGLDTGTEVNEFSIDGTLGGDSDDVVPTEQAVKTYVDAQIIAAGSGTVVSVGSGDGMDFSAITTTGDVDLGVGGAVTNTSTNAVTATSHTHSITNGVFTDVANVFTDEQTLNDNIDLNFGTGQDWRMVSNGTALAINYWDGAEWDNSISIGASSISFSVDDVQEFAIGTSGVSTQTGSISAFTYFDVGEIATPAQPASGRVKLYAKAGGHLYFLDDADVEHEIAIEPPPIPIPSMTMPHPANSSIDWEGLNHTERIITYSPDGKSWRWLVKQYQFGSLTNISQGEWHKTNIFHKLAFNKKS